MKAVIIVFPGTNREKDMGHAFALAGFAVEYVFYKDTLPAQKDIIILPGGFSYGDYLRTGAMASLAPVMQEIKTFADQGGLVLGICNGFQILCEAGLLAGVLMPNRDGAFICKTVTLNINTHSKFFQKATQETSFSVPIAHGEGNYFATPDMIKKLQDNQQIILTYQDNPNGSVADIAGISNKKGNILGMMPHPENHVDAFHDNQDGMILFNNIASLLS